MGKKIMYILLLIITIIPMKHINANEIYTCDYKEKARLNKIAANVSFSIEYKETNKGVEFTTIITNLHPDIYIIDTSTNKKYYYNAKSANPKEIKISGYKDGVSIRYEMHMVNKICKETLLTFKYANFPPYNPFYKDPLCKDIKEFSLCRKWIKVNYNYNEFKKQVEKYKTETIVEVEKDIEKGYLFNFVDFYLKYYMYILPVIILVSSGIIYIVNRDKEFNF